MAPGSLISGLLLSLAVTSVVSQSNLPDVPPGVFNVSARIEIQSNTSIAWETLNNFPGYPDWNPFVRSSIAVSLNNVTLPEQRPALNRRLILRTQIPPLPLPVNRNTPDNPLNTQFAYENVTLVDPVLFRLAWAYAVPTAGTFEGVRYQALSDIGNGKILYESREVFHGPLANVLRALMEANLQKSFEGQAAGLKLFLESK